MMDQMFQQMRTMNREQMKKRRPDVSEEENGTLRSSIRRSDQEFSFG